MVCIELPLAVITKKLISRLVSKRVDVAPKLFSLMS